MTVDQGRDKDETQNKRNSYTIRNRVPRSLADIGNQIIGAVVTTVTLSLGFMIFNDYIAPPPNLAGRWKFTVLYEETDLKRFKDLKVNYQALLIQEGLELSGTGEKLSEQERGKELKKHNGKPVEIIAVGNITRNYFSRDALVIHYVEKGTQRVSSTLHQLVYFDEQTMCGCYQSTIANTVGSVWWQRVYNGKNLHRSVERPAACSDVDCQASRSKRLLASNG